MQHCHLKQHSYISIKPGLKHTGCCMRQDAHACIWDIVRDHAIAFQNIIELDDWWASPTQASGLAISAQFKLLLPRD